MRLEEKGSIKTALKYVAGLKVRAAVRAAPRWLLLPIFFYLVYPVTERSMLLACTDLSSNSEVDIERRRNRQAFEKVAAYYRIYCDRIDRFSSSTWNVLFLGVVLLHRSPHYIHGVHTDEPAISQDEL